MVVGVSNAGISTLIKVTLFVQKPLGDQTVIFLP